MSLDAKNCKMPMGRCRLVNLACAWPAAREAKWLKAQASCSAALAGNGAIALAKFAAAGISGSTASHRGGPMDHGRTISRALSPSLTLAQHFSELARCVQ